MQTQLKPTERQRRARQSLASKAAWKVNEWAFETSLSKSFVHELISEQKIKSVKLGGARLILTSPAAFLSSLAEQQSQDAA
ncbi:MAG: hypothetical protein GEV13_10645 [Rhodospirillales bacterium]|nr:hypothetical protein [Rhodospirillales bacterium]